MPSIRHVATSLLWALLTLALVACGDDGQDTAATTTSTRAVTSESTTSTTAVPEPLVVLVTNDDGIGAPGIDAMVTALQQIEGVELVVVAPAENQSGSSDTTTPGEIAFADGTTASGVAGTAVEGKPADAVDVALDELGIEPDLVVSGVNEGQNVGPFAEISGTVGAARTAVRAGVHAAAASAGLGETADFAAAAALIVEWFLDHRDAIADGSLPTDAVVSFNVPGCTAGEIGDLVEVPLATEIAEGTNVFETDCSLEDTPAPTNDVEAMIAGVAAETLVPADL